MTTAAFFDLDGTLLTVNSASLWFKRQLRLGRVRHWQFMRNMFWLGGYKLGMLDMNAALPRVLADIRGVSEADLRAEAHEWWNDEVKNFIAPGSHAVLKAHRDAGDRLVLLTSGSRYTAEIASAEFGLDDILYQPYEVVEGRFTGAPIWPLCYGAGKVLIAEEWARRAGVDLAASSFYSDSLTDLPMLDRVARPFTVQPDPRLRRLARRRGWPVLDWTQAKPTL